MFYQIFLVIYTDLSFNISLLCKILEMFQIFLHSKIYSETHNVGIDNKKTICHVLRKLIL